MVLLIGCSEFDVWGWGLSPTDTGHLSGIGLFDNLDYEERETWTAGLWRSGSDAVGVRDFGGPVSDHSIKS